MIDIASIGTLVATAITSAASSSVILAWLNNRANKKTINAQAKAISDQADAPLVTLMSDRVKAIEGELADRRKSEALCQENYHNLRLDFEVFKVKHGACVVPEK